MENHDVFCVCVNILFVSIFAYAYGRSGDTVLADFGPYIAHIRNISKCRNAKGYLKVSTRDGEQVLIADFPITSEIGPLTLKMTTWKQSGLEFKQLTHFTSSKPCQHFFYGPVIGAIANLTEKCFLRKGNYNVVANVNEYTHKLFGDKFFRGVFRLRVHLFNKKTAIVCQDVETEMVPV